MYAKYARTRIHRTRKSLAGNNNAHSMLCAHLWLCEQERAIERASHRERACSAQKLAMRTSAHGLNACDARAPGKDALGTVRSGLGADLV